MSPITRNDRKVSIVSVCRNYGLRASQWPVSTDADVCIKPTFHAVKLGVRIDRDRRRALMQQFLRVYGRLALMRRDTALFTGLVAEAAIRTTVPRAAWALKDETASRIRGGRNRTPIFYPPAFRLGVRRVNTAGDLATLGPEQRFHHRLNQARRPLSTYRSATIQPYPLRVRLT